ncbi:MAG: hypothetical protein RBT74_13590 [Tenuifilaceae bacterium]|jgi:formylmethanofuran dehydrogenase subunit C|nr:hypothetical protein [Tenuifilaceae bacterium]
MIRHILKSTTLQTLILALALTLAGSGAWGQTTGDYRTNASGTWSWTTVANWEVYNGASWVVATNYPGQITEVGTATIQASTSVTLDVSPSYSIQTLVIDAVGSELVVNGTYSLAAGLSIGGGNLTIGVSGKFIIEGDLTLSSGIITNSGELIVKGDLSKTGGAIANNVGAIMLFAGNFSSDGSISKDGAAYIFDDTPVLGGLTPTGDETAAESSPIWTTYSSTLITWYSYRTAEWNHPDTWTTDPGGTTLVGTYSPRYGAKYVILQGRTVTLTEDVTQGQLSVTINSSATLNMGQKVFTEPLEKLAGQGLLKLNNTSLPTASTNTFVDSNGGTIEFNNSVNFTLPATTYNNLTLNLGGAANMATMLGNITLNGNLSITKGVFRINDNTPTTKLELTINGNVSVSSAGSITVGNGSTNDVTSPHGITGGTAPFMNYYEKFHRVVINGNFTNNGTVRFTNLNYPVYNAFPPLLNTATSGAASVYFMGNTNSSLVCNGTTDFYNLILDKGIDQTYELSINSTDYPNFRLFGANSAAGETLSGESIFKKALWIRNGTLRLYGEVVIPSLTEGAESGTPNSDYYIPSTAGFVIEGPDVVVLSTAVSYLEINAAYGVSATSNTDVGINDAGTGAVSLSVYGTLQVNEGYLSTRQSGGIIYWGSSSGQILINGGTVDARQLRTAGSSGGLTAYRQAGGILSLRGRFTQTITAATIIDVASLRSVPVNTSSRNTTGLQAQVGTFNIDRDDNIFEMSGGTIEILDVCGEVIIDTKPYSRALEVNSLPAYYNVTGGNIVIKPTSGGGTDYPYDIVSSAPLYNVSIDRVSGAQPVRLTNIPAIIPPSTTKAGVTQRLNPPLVVLNNLSLSNGATLNASSYEVKVGGNFTLPTGNTYTPGTNRTTFNGSGTQTFTGGGTITGNFNVLKVDKPSGTITLAGDPASYTVSDSLIITQGTLDDGGKTLNVAGHIYVGGTHTGDGKIVLNGTSAQTIEADVLGEPSLGNIELNNNSNPGARLLSHLTIGPLTLNADIGGNSIFDIQKYLLNITGGVISSTGTLAFGPTKMVRTNGSIGARGLKVNISLSGTTSPDYLFPVGVLDVGTNRYDPFTLLTPGNPGTTSGSITVVPINEYHSTVSKTGDVIPFYWTIKTTGFVGATPTGFQYFFSYHGTINNNQNAASYLDYNSTDGWVQSGSVDQGNSTITFSTGLGFISTDFTAGKKSAFNKPRILYSLTNGDWHLKGTWTENDTHTGGSTNQGPRVFDRLVIGVDHQITMTTSLTRVAGVEIKSATNPSSPPTLIKPAGATAYILTAVSGGGRYQQFDNNTPDADFEDFCNNETAVFEYAGGAYTIGTAINTYPNLHITSTSANQTKTLPDASILVRGNLRMNSTFTNSNLALNSSTSARTLTVYGNLEQTNASRLTIPATTGQKTINIYGDINFMYNSTDQVNGIVVTSGAGTTHKLNFYGSTITSGRSLLSFYNAGVSNQMDLYLFGSGNTTITNTTNLTTNFTLNSLIVNKGSLSDNVYFQNNFTLGAATNTTPKALQLNTGTLILEHPSTNITLTTGGGVFTIPQTGALILRGGAKVEIPNTAANNTGVFLDGLLRAEGSSEINIGNGGNGNNYYIEYSGSRNAAIELLENSVLRVNSQIRRSTAQTNGVLKYTQSGSSQTTIFGNGVNQTRAKLEVVNAGSLFSMSDNSTLTIVRGGGTTFGDLYLRPASGSVTGGTINIGSTVNNQTFKFDASTALNNLSIVSPSASNNAQLMVSPLVLNGTLNIGANTTFDANSINVTLKGDLTNNGTYTPGTNTTTLNGNVQLINGSNAVTPYNLVVNPTTSVTLSRDIIVENNLEIQRGTLSTGVNDIEVKGNLTNNATHSSSDGRLILNGINGQQNIYGSGTYSYLELDNNDGARLNNNITLTKNFYLTNGILNINQYLLTLREDSYIEILAEFGPNRMIAPDGVYSNVGIRKYFNAIASETTFTFPLGVTGTPNKYTPALVTITSTDAGFIRVNSINDRHPATTDPWRVLKYYWEVESSVTNFWGEINVKYDQLDVKQLDSDEVNYVAARVIEGSDQWSKALEGSGTDNVDESLNKVYFNFEGVNNMGGEYTAGHFDDIPNVIPTYYSKAGSGNWDNINHWDPVAPAGGPSGFIVVIPSGSTVVTNGNRRFAYRTAINGRLEVGDTYGHNLGLVTGTGTLALENPNLPAGRFTNFLTCAGGGLEYGGTDDYDIISDRIETLRFVHFVGSGTRWLPDKDWVICDEFRIDGPIVDNKYNRQLTIGGAMNRDNGTFLSGTGAGATVKFNGIAPQFLSGFNTSTGSPLNNLEIDNPDGLALGSQIDFKGDLKLTSGKIVTTDLNLLYMLNDGGGKVVVPEGGKSTSYVDGPMRKKVMGGSDFVFPVGMGSRYGKLALISPSNDDWTVEYFNSAYVDPDVISPLTTVSSSEHWRVIAPNNTTSQATVRLRWDGLSDINPTSVAGGSANMRVAEFDGNNWVEKTTVVDDVNQTVRTDANIFIKNTGDPQYYTLGAVTTVTPRARFATLDDICEGTLIPVTFSGVVAADLNYEIKYTINNIDETTVTITALPYPGIPTAGKPGTYRLTSFRYRVNGTPQGGTVDNAEALIVNESPVAPTASDVSRCGPGSVTLEASGAVAGENYRWYTAATGGTMLQEDDATYITPYINITTTYYVAIYNATSGCESNRTAVQAIIKPKPEITLLGSAEQICDGQPFTLTVNFTTFLDLYSILITENAVSIVNEAADDQTANPFEYTNASMEWNGTDPGKVYSYGVTVTKDGCVNDPVPNVTVTVWKIPETGPQYHIPNTFGE